MEENLLHTDANTLVASLLNAKQDSFDTAVLKNIEDERDEGEDERDEGHTKSDSADLNYFALVAECGRVDYFFCS